MTILEQLRKAIEEGHPGDTEKLVREALKQHISSAKIVEEAMTPAMRTVGENYKTNGSDIIKILAAARSVRKSFELLEEQDAQFSRRNIGTVILGTVEGDLHDVGKNLVAIMFRSAGFKVIDLGVDISEKQFLRAVKQNPDVSIVRPLQAIRDHYPKIILTMDEEPEEQYEGIRRINARDWLLGIVD